MAPAMPHQMLNAVPALADPARLAALRDSGLLDLPHHPRFERLVELLRRTVDVPILALTAIDATTLYFKCAHGLPEPFATDRRATPPLPLCLRVINTGRPLIIPNIPEHDIATEHPELHEFPAKAYLGAPIKLPSGHSVGTLCALDVVPRTWSDSDREAFFTIADAVASELENQALLRAQAAVERSLRKSNLGLKLLADFASSLLSDPDPRALVRDIYAKLADLLGAELYWHYGIDPAADATGDPQMLLLHSGGLSPADHRTFDKIKVGQYACGYVASTRAPAYIPHFNRAEHPGATWAAKSDIRVYAAEPLLSGEQLLGTLSFGSRNRDTFSEDELSLIRTVGHYVAAVETRIRSDKAVRASQEHFGLALEAAAMGSWLIDVSARTVRVDAILNRILGLPPFETLEPLDVCFAAAHPQDRARVIETWEATLATRGTFEVEYRYVRPDGQVQWLREQGRFLPGEPGGGDIVRGVTLDITHHKRSEEALRLARDAAESANRAKDRFLAVLSHELRTPLTPVLLALGALDADPRIPADVHDDLTMMRKNVELETRLIDDLLDLSRIVSGKLFLASALTPFAQAVIDACAICRPQITEKSIRLTVDLDPAPATVLGDPARLRQAFWNVLKNAARFTPEGGEIRVVSRVAGARVSLSVTDTGPGISAELLPRIFDAFEQGAVFGPREAGGLGLGLAISRAIVELHSGTIRAGPAHGHTGSTFTIELPIVSTPVPTTPPAKPLAKVPLRLLVVEDHAYTARILARILRSSGYTVRTANTAADALRLAADEPFDLLVSDIGLPDATGYDLMRQLRLQYNLAGIAMSGYGMEEDTRRSAEAGFSEHLVKPVKVAQLEESIRRVAASPALAKSKN